MLKSIQTALQQKLSKDSVQAVFYLLPATAILLVFSYYPLISILNLSLYKWENLSPEKTFIGFQNYLNLFSNERFWNSLNVTFTYTSVVTIVSIAAGLLLAVALNNRYLILKSFWRSLYFLPSVTPTVAAAMVWILLFNPSIGYVNKFLDIFHIQGINWLADSTWALPTVMLLGIWRRAGFNLIIYLAALQAIPNEYYESAMVDGANPFRRFIHLTVPLLKPTTIMLVILGIIDSFLIFDQIMVLTRGGPLNATEVIGWYMYNNAFTFLKMGYGSAISVVIFIIIAVLTLLQWRFVGFGSMEDAE
ncbi:MAG TPA: sugar ABC transporter permease [Anaerolineales bacterium]|nr:sugar ABC transporter permease [Anaerolineales bacterium]